MVGDQDASASSAAVDVVVFAVLATNAVRTTACSASGEGVAESSQISADPSGDRCGVSGGRTSEATLKDRTNAARHGLGKYRHCHRRILAWTGTSHVRQRASRRPPRQPSGQSRSSRQVAAEPSHARSPPGLRGASTRPTLRPCVLATRCRAPLRRSRPAGRGWPVSGVVRHRAASPSSASGEVRVSSQRRDRGCVAFEVMRDDGQKAG